MTTQTDPVDGWTLVHFAAGYVAGQMGLTRNQLLTVAVGYEIVEQWIERTQWGQDFFNTSGPEVLANAAIDVGVAYLGWEAGR